MHEPIWDMVEINARCLHRQPQIGAMRKRHEHPLMPCGLGEDPAAVSSARSHCDSASSLCPSAFIVRRPIEVALRAGAIAMRSVRPEARSLGRLTVSA